jgi:hypothetical protein
LEVVTFPNPITLSGKSPLAMAAHGVLYEVSKGLISIGLELLASSSIFISSSSFFILSEASMLQLIYQDLLFSLTIVVVALVAICVDSFS